MTPSPLTRLLIVATALLAWALAPLAARADGFNAGDSLVVHVACRHGDRDAALNEVNPGLGVRLGRGWGFWMAGGYLNSLAKPSLYAGAGKTLYTLGPASFNILGGLITGYSNVAAPLLLPEVAVHAGPGAVLFNFVPPVKTGQGGTAGGVVSLSFSVKF